MSVEAARENFFKAEHFAVAGASKDQKKIGNQVSLQGFTFYEWPEACFEVFRWYKSHGLSVVPIHPKEASVEEIQTIASVFDIYEPNLTSLSIITPGHVSLPIVKTALLELGVHGIWLQPGAENDELIEYIKSMPEELQNKVVYGGPCILVEGAELAKAQGKL